MPSPTATRPSVSAVSASPPMPSVRSVPVAGEGQASRTNQTRSGSVGAGRVSVEPVACQIERHQPVAPVPVPTMTPLEDWRSLRLSAVDSR